MPNPLFWLYIVVVRSQYHINQFRDKRDLIRKKRIILREFKKLKWNKRQVWDMTSYCSSLEEAVKLLSNKLLEQCNFSDRRLYSYSENLILDGYDRSWS